VCGSKYFGCLVVDEVVLKILHGEFSLAYHDEAAYDDAHHFAEETVGRDLETEPVAGGGLVEGGLGDVADGVLVTVGAFAEGAVVGVLGQQGYGLCHLLQVPIGLEVEGAEAAQERIFISVDIVVVGAFDGIEPGMILRVGGDDVEYRDIIWQELVKAEEQFILQRFRHIHMEEELAGVYLCVGTAAAGNGYGCFEYFGKRGFEHLLYVDAVGVALPAAVVGTVVGDM